jgi:hypothetical protein
MQPGMHMSNYNEFLFVDQEKKFGGFRKLLESTTRQAVMLIEAPQDMGKTWLIGKMQKHCQEPVTNIPVAQIDFRSPRQVIEVQDYLGLVRFIRDRLGHARHFNNLNITINNFGEVGARAQSGLAALRQRLEQYFNLDELKELTFDLEVNYENLPGETLRSKTRELVNYCQRHNMLPRLVALCASLRSSVDWRQGLEALRLTQTTEADDTEAITADNLDPVWAHSDAERQRAERQINEAFFECLAQLTADRGRVVLLFDSCEAAPPEAERWLIGELLPRLRDQPLEKLVVILTGRKTPDLTDLDITYLAVETGLDPFAEEHVREYFEEKRNIKGLDLRTIILTSGGVPGALAMMADHAMATAEEDDDFFSDV